QVRELLHCNSSVPGAPVVRSPSHRTKSKSLPAGSNPSKRGQPVPRMLAPIRQASCSCGRQGGGHTMTNMPHPGLTPNLATVFEPDLAHMNRVSMMGELAASLAHEITQPIASARNNARAALNFLDRQPSDLGDAREALACVLTDVDRARDIIDRICEHMKKAPPRKERFELNQAIDEVMILGRSAIIRNDVSVQTRFAAGLLAVEGDRVQLQQV